MQNRENPIARNNGVVVIFPNKNQTMHLLIFCLAISSGYFQMALSKISFSVCDVKVTPRKRSQKYFPFFVCIFSSPRGRSRKRGDFFQLLNFQRFFSWEHKTFLEPLCCVAMQSGNPKKYIAKKPANLTIK